MSFDELLKEERPPRRLWLDDEGLQAHFDRVDRDRKAQYGGEEAIDDPVSNDAAKLLIAD